MKTAGVQRYTVPNCVRILFAIRETVNTDSFFEESTEQSRIKAAIVRDYFWSWAKIILKKQRGRIAYIDLFAGPGRYKNGTKSTPLLVLERAIADPDMRERLSTVFNDADPANVRLLRAEIAELPGIEKLKHQPDVDVGEVGGETVQAFRKISLIPTLLFADPWGYKGLSLDLIGSFLKNWGVTAYSSSTTTASIPDWAMR